MASISEGVVLLVDHDPAASIQTSRGLELAGYRVLGADTGLEALEMLRSDTVDVVLLDVTLPVMSGLETLRAIRQTWSSSWLPVLMLTSNERSNDVLEALELGANDYVTKPVEPAVLLARIRTHVAARWAERARRQSEERLAALAAGSQDGLWDWHVESGDLFVSMRWKATMGWPAAPAADTLDTWMTRVHPDDVPRVRADLAAHLDGSTTRFESEHRLAHEDGTYRWVVIRGQALRDDHGQPVRVAGSLTDVTSQRITDPLTGLPNREVCLIRLGGLLQQCQRDPERPFAVISLDLDHFTLVNDSLGHVAGDQLLTEVAGRLAGCLRGTDTVVRERSDAAAPVLARCGGDEFTILLEDLALADDAVRVATRILHVLSGPFCVQGKQVCLSASLGIAYGSADTRHAHDVLSEADAAMFRAKSLGGRRYDVFDAAVHEDAQRRLRLETDLRWAIERHELVLHYQPVVDVASGRLTGFSAETRWQRPGMGVVRLDEIRAEAETTGVASAIDRWTLEAACAQMAKWNALAPDLATSLHVTASAPTLRRPDVVSELEATMARSGLDPARLTLEVPARMLEAGEEATVGVLNTLRQRGVAIGLTGIEADESALGSLTRFPFNALTIHGCQVQGDPERDAPADVIRTLVGVAKSLSIATHAAAIESTPQLEALRALGVELARGSLFGAAVSASAAEVLLTTGWRYVPDLSLTA
jgi:diguanylate cyclase (GGDEF)-like protein/PAS domain S-box-containing protein